MQSDIHFYAETGPYGFLSNFSDHPVSINGHCWPTTEHYFQAQKFAGTELEERIRLAPSPLEAARIGRSRDLPLRDDWNAVKDAVMAEALHAKFTQHETLTRQLLETGCARLVQHTAFDSYWGDGGDGRGRNRLGVLLMALRETLANPRQVAEP